VTLGVDLKERQVSLRSVTSLVFTAQLHDAQILPNTQHAYDLQQSLTTVGNF